MSFLIFKKGITTFYFGKIEPSLIYKTQGTRQGDTKPHKKARSIKKKDMSEETPSTPPQASHTPSTTETPRKSPAKKRVKLTEEQRLERQKEREQKQKEKEEELKAKEQRKEERERQRLQRLEEKKKHAEEVARRKKEQEEARQRKKDEEEQRKREREEAFRKRREEKDREEQRKREKREKEERERKERKEEEERKKKEKEDKELRLAPKISTFFHVKQQLDTKASDTNSEETSCGPFKPYELQRGTAWFRPWLVPQAPEFTMTTDDFVKELRKEADQKDLLSEFTKWAKERREKSIDDMSKLREQKAQNLDLNYRRKMLFFSENSRPAFRGKLEMEDSDIHPRNFLFRKSGIEYDYDSGVEWDEPSGDEIGSEEEKSDNEMGQQADDDGGDPFIVSDDYLSEEEGTEGERDELMAISIKKDDDLGSDGINCVGIAFDLDEQKDNGTFRALSCLPVCLLNPFVKEKEKTKDAHPKQGKGAAVTTPAAAPATTTSAANQPVASSVNASIPVAPSSNNLSSVSSPVLTTSAENKDDKDDQSKNVKQQKPQQKPQHKDIKEFFVRSGSEDVQQQQPPVKKKRITPTLISPAPSNTLPAPTAPTASITSTTQQGQQKQQQKHKKDNDKCKPKESGAKASESNTQDNGEDILSIPTSVVTKKAGSIENFFKKN